MLFPATLQASLVTEAGVSRNTTLMTMTVPLHIMYITPKEKSMIDETMCVI